MKHLSLALVGSALLIASTVAGAADLSAGKATWEQKNCASCHGADAKSPILPEYPVLAGQHYSYLAHALKAYQRGAHDMPNTANGRKNAVMGGMAMQLTSQDEVNNVAAWLESLPGPLSVHK